MKYRLKYIKTLLKSEGILLVVGFSFLFLILHRVATLNKQLEFESVGLYK